MLFRRIKAHIAKEDWFAVFIDFIIVVFGVFMGFQVNNWNNSSQDKLREVALLSQLQDEFTEIETQLQEETVNARERLIASKYVVKIIDENARSETDEVKLAFIRNMGLGRLPSTSATYRQLVSNGDLTLLSNEELRRSLIKYHDTIDKNAFLFEQTLNTVSQYIKTNSAVTVDVNAENFSATNPKTITDIEWDDLATQRPYFVNMFIFNNLFNAFYTEELANAKTVLELVEENRGE